MLFTTALLKLRALAYYFAKFCQKLHGNEKNWSDRERFLGAPLRPATVIYISTLESMGLTLKGFNCSWFLRMRSHPDASMMSQFPAMPQFMMHETTNQIIQNSAPC